MARLDAGAGRWPRELAGELTRVALRCVERQREVRAGHARDVHPALLDLAARSLAEKELRQQHMDSRFVCPLSEVHFPPRSHPCASLTYLSQVLPSCTVQYCHPFRVHVTPFASLCSLHPPLLVPRGMQWYRRSQYTYCLHTEARA